MNILYISQYFPPEVCAPAVRAADLGHEWVRAGHEVRLLTGFPNHPEGVLHSDYRQQWRKGFSRENRDGVKVYRTWLYPAANRGLWGRSANYCSFAVSAALVGPWIAPRNGVVIATSPQLLVGATGYMVAQARRLPFVFEVRDLWPQSLEAVGAAQRSSIIYRSLERLARFLYQRADCIVVDGEWKRFRLAAAGIQPEKIVVIQNGVAEDFCLEPESAGALSARQQLRIELNLLDKFVVMYCGTFGMAHGLETVLMAADRLRPWPEIAFLLLGEGAERDKIRLRIDELRLSNLHCLGKQTRERIPEFLAASDACLVPLLRSKVFKTAIPSKMFEAMLAAKPVILGVEGEAKEILLEADAGIAVPPEDSEALAGTILTLCKNPVLGLELGANGRRAVLEKYTRRHQSAAYLELLARLVNTPRHHPASKRSQPAEPTSARNPEMSTTRKA
ncbi:MAG TPA: glycosyltransferase family 4 protein [Candidatus Bathyarchaeia archaeon]|nr:glycosyltransferase family 4 protein [Candidatus Bathyarchaeia archaeon]